MSVAFRQLRVYFRTVIVVVVVAAIALVLFKNRRHEAQVWFFGLTGEDPINVVWLMLCTGGATLVTWWAVSLIRGLIRDAREIQRARAIRDEKRRLAEQEAALKERERRLDEKVHGVISQEESEDGNREATSL